MIWSKRDKAEMGRPDFERIVAAEGRSEVAAEKRAAAAEGLGRRRTVSEAMEGLRRAERKTGRREEAWEGEERRKMVEMSLEIHELRSLGFGGRRFGEGLWSSIKGGS